MPLRGFWPGRLMDVEPQPPEPGFGIYVHWPFCAAKCPYCDFNSHVRAGVDHEVWASALTRDLAAQAARMDRETVTSVFFGGGTPSLMAPATVAAVLDQIAALWPVAAEAEITLEANPTSSEADRFAAFRAAGVNRLSLGVQALDDTALRKLGRQHSAAEALRARDMARAAFERVSFDLIYARQDQSLDAWREELGRALALGPDHLSLYQLTIEPGTAFGARHAAGGLRGLPDDTRAADLYAATQELCDRAGLPAYEVSNHARPGAESRHNLTYWRYGRYLGTGPGAHGRIARNGRIFATEAVRTPEAWLADASLHETGIAPEEQAEELLMMGLRLREGVDLARYNALAATPLPQSRIDTLAETGLLTQTGPRLTATPQGRMVLNRVLLELLR